MEYDSCACYIRYRHEKMLQKVFKVKNCKCCDSIDNADNMIRSYIMWFDRALVICCSTYTYTRNLYFLWLYSWSAWRNGLENDLKIQNFKTCDSIDRDVIRSSINWLFAAVNIHYFVLLLLYSWSAWKTGLEKCS